MMSRIWILRRILSSSGSIPTIALRTIRRTNGTAPAPTTKMISRTTALPGKRVNASTGIPTPCSGSAALARCGGQ